MEELSARSGKSMRAVCISPRAESMWLRSHMTEILKRQPRLEPKCNSIQLTNSNTEHRVQKGDIHHREK